MRVRLENLLPDDFCRPSRECIEVALGNFPPAPPALLPLTCSRMASDMDCDCAEAVKCDKSKGPPVEAERLSCSFPLAIEAIPGIGGGGGIGGGIASEDAP